MSKSSTAHSLPLDHDMIDIVADLGGTNTRVALAQNGSILPHTIKRYPNASHNGLEDILGLYTADQNLETCQRVCIALAGLVEGEAHNGVGKMTNLDWTVDAALLRRATGAQHVAILNDLQAQGYAVGHVTQDKTRSITTGKTSAPSPRATSLVVNVGTGFNAAAVFETAAGRLVAASECGHTNLPVRTPEALGLHKFIETHDGFAAIEDVLSGRGLERTYLYMGTKVDDPVRKTAADIMAAVNAGTDKRADASLEVFVGILGAVCGDLALTHLPFGGIYLVGGVAAAVAPSLERFGFGQAFRDKGRFEEFMQNFSVSAIEDDYAALIGCASYLHINMK